MLFVRKLKENWVIIAVWCFCVPMLLLVFSVMFFAR